MKIPQKAEFILNVKKHSTPIGTYGTIRAAVLRPYIGKRVRILLEVVENE